MLLMFGVIGAVAPGLLRAVAWPMVAACLTLLTVALLFLGKGSSVAASSIKLSESAFKLSHALMLALLMGGVSLLSAGLQALFGGAGVMVTAVVVAIVEVHAAASVAQMSLSSALPPSLASWSLVAVLASSAAAKTLLAWFSGGLAFGWRVGLGLWLMVLSATVTLVLPMAALALEVIPPLSIRGICRRAWASVAKFPKMAGLARLGSAALDKEYFLFQNHCKILTYLNNMLY